MDLSRGTRPGIGALTVGAAVLASTLSTSEIATTDAVAEAPSREEWRTAACVGGWGAMLAQATPERSASRVLATLREEDREILDVCGRATLEAAIVADGERRVYAACRLSNESGVPCERLIREIALYRLGE